MYKLNLKQQKIISIILENNNFSSSKIYKKYINDGEIISLASIKRILSDLVKKGFLISNGVARSTHYSLSILGRVFFNIDANSYVLTEPDKRSGLSGYNFNLFSEFPLEIFNKEEIASLNKVTQDYHKKSRRLSKVIRDKELQRLIIELSWKSSKIEGNTYTLLDTEKLILENREAYGHKEDEARMILNHKDAFNFIRENINEYKNLSIANMEKLHSILIKDLGVGKGLRKGVVGVTGSKYRPIDNVHQIREAISLLSKTISKAKLPYNKAILAILGISYIQPFDDGNKRTGRLMANALLLAHNCAPLSYRSVDEMEYRSAVLVFYEINSILPFKKIFIEQYNFAAKNYATVN